MQVIYFLRTQGKAFFLVVCFQVVDETDGSRLNVDGKDVLVEALVKALQHRVVRSILVLGGEILFYARYPLDVHVLGNLHSIGTPGSNHFATRAYVEAFQLLFVEQFCLAIKPAEFLYILIAEMLLAFRCDDSSLRCLEKENSHAIIVIIC